MSREQERHKRNVDALNQRKEVMIRERKQKMKDDLERLKVTLVSRDHATLCY